MTRKRRQLGLALGAVAAVAGLATTIALSAQAAPEDGEPVEPGEMTPAERKAAIMKNLGGDSDPNRPENPGDPQPGEQWEVVETLPPVVVREYHEPSETDQ